MKSERFWKLLAISIVLLVAAGVAAAVTLPSLNSDETLGVVASSSHVDKHPKMSTEVAAKIPPPGIAPPAELMTVNIYLNTNKTEDLEELQNHTAEILRIKRSRMVAKIYTSEIVDIADLSFVTYMDTPLQTQLFSNVAISETGGGSKDSRMSTEVADSIPPPGIAPPAKPMIVNLYLKANETEKIKELENYTIDILYEKENMIVAEIYTREIIEIVDLPFVSYMDTPIQTQLFSDTTVGKGVKCINADKQHNLGTTGKGVKVAIVDHGFEGYEDLLGTELPENVTVMSFLADGDITGGGIIHGTACAEIVHDVAPDAELYLVNYRYAYQLEEIVDYLISEGVDIISHSAGGTAGRFDGTDYNCWIIDNAVFRHGIKWVNAAGNQAQRHWEGIFNDADGDGYHEVPDGELGQMFCANEGEVVVLHLSWNESWGYATQDYDFYIRNSSGGVVAASENPQNGTFGHRPVEGVGFLAPYTDCFSIVIEKYSATKPVHFELYSWYHDLGCRVEDSSLCVEATAWGSTTVGALTCEDCSTLESYSSRGPTNDGRIKPDYVGPDCVSTCAYSPDPFCGTSAATPHVAGALALQLSSIKESHPGQKDNQFGYGLPKFGG
jgi:subtilisin family serine protease